jgi:Gluconate 2-dehydrogenase subunit 3
MDRRTTIKWMLAAAAAVPSLRDFALGAEPIASATVARLPAGHGYGTDPKLMDAYKPGELWPLTFTPRQRRTATVLSDLIIPADDTSPSASAVGVVDFIDEWISAPYKRQQQDRKAVLEGFKWLDRESARRFSQPFVALDETQQRAICDDICYAAKAKPRFAEGAKFFARYRDLTAGGFYTTPAGRKDLQDVGNTPLTSFDGPPLEVLKKVGLA